jgi:hypothetical protein
MEHAVSDEVTADTAPTARIEVVGGGPVSAEHLAAVVVALTPTAGADVATPAPTGPPAWARAALLEGVGMLPPTRPSDLQQAAVLG